MSKAPLRTVSIVLAMLSFVATSGLVRSRLAGPERDEAAEKLSYLRRSGDDYTALILGSSAIYRGLVPAVLDREVRRVVPEFKSFNLGVRAMRAFEKDKMLRDAVEVAGDQLRWVILEPQSWTPRVEEEFRETERTVDWHDLPRTWGVVSATLSSGMQPDDRNEWLLFHLRSYFYRLGNYGQIERLSRGLFGGAVEQRMTDAEIALGHGYISIEGSEPRTWKKRNRRFRNNLESYRKKLATLNEGRSGHVSEIAVELHREQREWLEARGLTVIYVMPPFAGTGRFGWTLAEAGEMPLFVDFLDPESYPELYSEEARLDGEHLKADAAAELSRMCGERIAALLGPGSGAIQ